jgi:hypothetical protein
MVAEDHRALTSGPGTLVTVLPIGAREVHGLSKEYSDDSMTVLPRYRTPRGRGVVTRVVRLPLVSVCRMTENLLGFGMLQLHCLG